MSKRVDREEFSSLVSEVIDRLAKDRSARHLWQWRSRPDCEDEPYGQGRRRSLRALLGLLAVGTVPAATAQCSGDESTAECGDDPCACGDDPCGCGDDPCACADDPCASGGSGPGGGGSGTGGSGTGGSGTGGGSGGGMMCGDDPCASGSGGAGGGTMCADDPCACGDDPCSGGT